jgi:site-specific DNA-methyltransferase (adenine-specific)
MIELLNKDCMEVMAQYPDKYFDLAIVDPPYGVSQPAFRKESKNKACKPTQYNNAVYNQPRPSSGYFNELFRISKDQIIWGANYFLSHLKEGTKWIFWGKQTEDAQWGDGELAYTSFGGVITKFDFAWNGMIQGDMKHKEHRIHPTQKPVHLYKWLLKNYAKPEFKIIDTHGGSMSSVIACYDFGITEMVCCEIDKEYFDAAVKRFEVHKMQTVISF